MHVCIYIMYIFVLFRTGSSLGPEGDPHIGVPIRSTVPIGHPMLVVLLLLLLPHCGAQEQPDATFL